MNRRTKRLVLVAVVSLVMFSTPLMTRASFTIQAAEGPAELPKVQLSLRAKLCLGAILPALGLHLLRDALGIPQALARSAMIGANLSCVAAALLLPYPHIWQVPEERQEGSANTRVISQQARLMP